ncbi:MAG TPA: hypothetical protein VG028_06480 [Terriglobia bacterium]|nr:hypothetical protein [Terriglobia bacterium]
MKKSIGHSEKVAGIAQLTRAALGFRAHSGWVAVVAVAGDTRSPKVVGRSRVELASLEIPRPVQPYHAAQKMELKKAEAHIARFAEEARNFAAKAMRDVVQELRIQGYQVVSCGIVSGSGRPAPTVKAALASHPLLHTAEGELFRNAIIQASRQCRLAVLQIKERELFARGVKELGLPLGGLQFILDKIGEPLGPPWGQDQKLASLMAWLALSGNETR